MDAISYYSCQKQFSKNHDQVCEDRSPIIYYPEPKSQSVVMISLENYGSAGKDPPIFLRSTEELPRLLESGLPNWKQDADRKRKTPGID